MKMAKPSERDIDAAGNLMSLLHQIDRGDYPNLDEDADVPDWFDADNFVHLRAFYDAIKATLDKGPGYPGRVIGGMCYVIMYDKNEIIDPDSDTLDMHPKIVKALELAEGAQKAPEEVRNQWISVEERLPELHQTVALLDEKRWMNTGSSDHNVNWHGSGYLCEFGSKYWSIFGEMRSQCLGAVTHWMPLPAAPSADQADTDENDDICPICEGRGEVQDQGSAPDIDPPIKKCSECNGSGKASYWRALRTSSTDQANADTGSAE